MTPAIFVWLFPVCVIGALLVTLIMDALAGAAGRDNIGPRER